MGYVHLYTGSGKGKSTAAIGLAIRAHYAGMKVYIGQFIRDIKYHETQIAAELDIVIEQLGSGCFLQREPVQQDVDAAQSGFELCRKYLSEGCYSLVILDELTIALGYNLIAKEQVVAALCSRHPDVEVVITGIGAPQWLIDEADLVTEMREVKHYYTTSGVPAREGIEW